MDESGPVEVIAASDPKATHGVRYKYGNGVEVLHGDGPGVEFNGSEGKVIVNRGKFELWIGGKRKEAAENKTAEKRNLNKDLDVAEKEFLADAKIKLYKSDDHKSDWLTAIKERKTPICDIETGARTVTVCHLINQSYYHHASFKWDPARNQFAGGTGDAAWLNNTHRDAWKV
jgi:hypothetical protein